MHVFGVDQIFLLVIIAFGAKTCEECRMTDNDNFLIFFDVSRAEVVLEEIPQLEAALIHFEGVLHTVGEFVIGKLQQVL